MALDTYNFDFELTDEDYLARYNVTENRTAHPTVSSLSPLGPNQAALLAFYALVCLLGVPGNALVVWVTGFRMTTSSVTSTWFLNLALADLLCCLSLPLLMVTIAGDEHWPFGQFACSLVKGVLYLFMNCSVLLLVLISLDRWLLVSRPVWCQNRRRPRHAAWVCVGVWCLALLGSVPQFLSAEVRALSSAKVLCVESSEPVLFALRFLLGFLLPFAAIVWCHFVVFRRAGGPTRGGGGGGAKRSHTLRVIVAVATSFFLCWLPLHVANLVRLNTPQSSPSNHVVSVALGVARCLAYLNSCLNPPLYACLGRGFKESVGRSSVFFRGVFHFVTEEPVGAGTRTSCSNTKSTAEAKDVAL